MIAPAAARTNAAMVGAALAVLVAAWATAASRAGVTGHMVAHMAAVAVASPLLAAGLAGTRFDLALRWPRLVAPIAMSLVELAVVWAWHVPAARAFAASSPIGLVLEQVAFVGAGLLLWSACLGSVDAPSSARRAAGVVALLLTTMHMTLLGVLVALAPRPLYPDAGFSCLGVTLGPLADQQLGGVLMLMIGAASYLAGGLMLLARLLRSGQASPA